MRVLWASLIVIAADQIAKLTVLKTMVRSRSIPVIGDWFKLTYTENPGMAFGVTFGPPALITILSLVATVVIVGYLVSVRRGYTPYRMSLALVLGGAVGNIIDRIFYGRIFYDLPYFQGRVVDFLHLDVWRGYLPEWLPILGGNAVALFPIGNVADVAIIAGVVGIIWFQRRFHEKAAADAELQTVTTVTTAGDAETAIPTEGQADVAGDPFVAADAAGEPTRGNDSPAPDPAQGPRPGFGG